MDRKSVVVLIVCGVLFMAWTIIAPRLYPPQPISRTNSLAGTVTSTSGVPDAVTAATNLLARADGLTNLTTAVTPPNAPEELLVVTNETARYIFTSHGGGLKMVELFKYPESVACGARRNASSNRLASLNGPASQPILSLLHAESWQGDGVYKLGKTTRTEPLPAPATNQTRIVEIIRAEKAIGTNLYLLKEFEISSNYLVRARVRIENHSGQPLAIPVQHWVVGSATPTNPHDDGTDVGLHWHDGENDQAIGTPWFLNKTLGCLPGTPRNDYSVTNSRLAWVTANNQFFFLALMARDPGQAVAAVRYPWPPPGPEELAADPTALTNQHALLVSLDQAAAVVGPGQALERHFTIFAGPKEYRLLQRLGAQLKNGIDQAMGFGGFYIFTVFSGILLLSMNALHSLGLSYALAIIAITVIIKILFWPLTQASTRSMKRMQTLQPQIKALQEKYKDDPKKQQEKMMEFWREHKINPVGGCLPMLLQIPVFIGFFQMVRTAIELRGATFLWACDWTRPDTIFFIPGLNFPVNPLPILMGITMFFQARLTPMSPGMDPAQQKMMKYFPMVFLVILYNYSAGLTLYWTVQNLLTITQTLLTRTKPEPAAKPAGASAGKALPPARPQPKKKK